MKRNVAYVKFDPNGPRLQTEIKFEGLILGSYEYILWEADSNQIIERHRGNNQNPWDDTYSLPVPVSTNDKRIVDVRAKFVGLDPDNAPNFKILVNIYQGGQLIGQAYDSNPKDKPLSGSGHTSQIYVFLQKNDDNTLASQ